VNISTDIGTWIMAFIMLSLFSFLWKENACSHIAESIYVGAGAGFTIAQAYNTIKDMAVYPLTQGQFSLIIPILLGLILYSRFSNKFSHLSRYAMAVPIGLGAGIALRALPSAQVLSQIKATTLPLTSINNILIVAGVVTTMSFFLFTVSQNKVQKVSSEIGKYYMFITFGLTFATAVFQHVGIYLGALQLLLGNWLGLI